MVQFTILDQQGRGKEPVWVHYTLWPDGDNHLSGAVGSLGVDGLGVAYINNIGGPVDLTCATEELPAIKWNDWSAQTLVTLHLVIHPDGNIWMVDVVESSRDRTRLGCRPTGHDARREGRGGRDLHRARPGRCASSFRHASLIVFVEINCFRPGNPQHCASKGVQPPVATAHTRKLTSTALRGSYYNRPRTLLFGTPLAVCAKIKAFGAPVKTGKE